MFFVYECMEQTTVLLVVVVSLSPINITDTRTALKKSSHCCYNKSSLCDIDVTWQPRTVDWKVHVWTMTASLYESVGAVDTNEWACVLCGHCIENDWASRATNLHKILHEAWTFLHRNYLDDSEGHSYGQLVLGSFSTTTCPVTHHISYWVFWENIKSPRWFSPPIAQMWRSVTSGFSQN